MAEKHIIIGAGPAGLTIASELSELGADVLVLEGDPTYVGGLARTVEYKGYRFDLGGHRFYSKSAEINRRWHSILPDDFLQVPRLSRIYYDNRFYPYPIEVRATLKNLGLWRSFAIATSYLRARCFPRRPEISFEDWIVNRFGRRLFRTFFETYTEKVWGIPCARIDKDWAAQRIRGFSLSQALKNALFPPRDGEEIKTLIRTFSYPRRGPGQLWEAVRDKIVSRGNRVQLGKEVMSLSHRDGHITDATTRDGSSYTGSHFYPTMTLKGLINALDPPPPPEILRAANALGYRDFLTVALIVDHPSLFPDNWIYIHDPAVHVGRIQNYKNWSKEMVPDLSKTCLGMEYFCNRGDRLWATADMDLITLAADELDRIGLARAVDCRDGCVVRVPDAYPVYDEHYKANREAIKRWLNTYFKNVYPAGRGGLHNYNSQDHAMMTGILSVQNVHERAQFDVWMINTDEEYSEEVGRRSDFEQRLTPRCILATQAPSPEDARYTENA